MPERMKFWSRPIRTAAVAVGLGQAGRLDQIDPVHPADRDRAPDVDQSGLLLGMHAHMVAPEAVGELAARRVQGEPGPLVQGGPESLGAELLRQIAHTGQATVLAVAQFAEELGHAAAELDRLVRTDEDVDVRRHPLAVGETAADEHVEPDRPVALLGRPEADVVDLHAGAVLETSGHRDLELAGQVGVLPVAGEVGGDRLGHRDGPRRPPGRRCPRPGRSRRCAPSRRRPARWSARRPRTAARFSARRRCGSSGAGCPGVS